MKSTKHVYRGLERHLCLSMMAHSMNILSVVRELLLKPAWKGSLSLNTSFLNESLLISIDSNSFPIHGMTDFSVIIWNTMVTLFVDRVDYTGIPYR